MTASTSNPLVPSSRGNPCPICGRTKDGDCRVGPDLVLCHRGSSHHPPENLRRGEVVVGDDGQQWAYTGETADDRAATFTLHKPREPRQRPPCQQRPRQQAQQQEQQVAAPSAPQPEQFARLAEPPPPPPDHLPAGHRIAYSEHQWTEWEDGTRTGRDGRLKSKGERPRHRDASGKTQYRAGIDPWPFFASGLLPHATGKWICAAEGPKCAMWLQAGGLVAVSQPGHDHKPASIACRFRELQAAGIAGMAYLADNDTTGRKKARQLARQAAAVGFPLVVLNAADVWPHIPDRGSIDDAPGTAAERVEAFLQSVAEGKGKAAEPETPESNQRYDSSDAAVPTDVGGIEAVLEAVGSGWRESRDGDITRSDLLVGDLSSSLNRRLGDRLGFDQLRLMPAVDGGALTAIEVDYLHVRLSENGWKNIGKDGAIDGLIRAAHLHPFHPVARYLEQIAANNSIAPISLSDIGPEYFGVTDPLHNRFLQIMLLGAVWRVMEPGCDFKTCVVLQSGQQTLFKSRSLEALAGPEYFTDSSQESEKDLFLAIHTTWLYELAEIETQTGKKEAGKLKNQLSSKVDTFRPPYGRGMQRMPRASVFVGTCNRDDFLVDDTGNSRFLVVPITQVLDYEKIERDRDRIWKAAFLAYQRGERPWLSRAEMAASEQGNRSYRAEHVWLAKVEVWLDANPMHQRGGFTTVEALTGADCRQGDQLRAHDEKEMASVLRALGYEREKHASRQDGKRARRWWPRADTRGTGDTPPGGTTCASPNSSDSQASNHPDTRDTSVSSNEPRTVEQLSTAHLLTCSAPGGTFPEATCATGSSPPNDCPANGSTPAHVHGAERVPDACGAEQSEQTCSDVYPNESEQDEDPWENPDRIADTRRMEEDTRAAQAPAASAAPGLGRAGRAVQFALGDLVQVEVGGGCCTTTPWRIAAGPDLQGCYELISTDGKNRRQTVRASRLRLAS